MMMENSLFVIWNNNRALMICNKQLFITTLSILIFIFTSFFNDAQAITKKGGLEYNDNRFDYSTLDTKKLIYEGNSYFNKALNIKQKRLREKTFDEAMGKYYLANKSNPTDAYTVTQMARIYSLKNQDRYANEYFFKAINLDRKSPHAHYHFGEFYFKKANLDKALKHYLIAYQNGYQNNFNLNCRLGIVYEKLADLKKANQYYKAALTINPQKTVLQKKIDNINSLNYDNSEYYYIIRE